MTRMRVFGLTSYGPHTALTGGRLRRDNIFAALVQRDHVVDRLDILARPGTRSALKGGLLSLTRHVRERARNADVVLLGDVFCLPMIPVLTRIGTPVVVDLVDSPYRLVSAAPRETIRERVTALAQSAQLLPVMQVLLPMANGVTYISAEDESVDAARVRRLPPTTVVPNGINSVLLDSPLTLPPDGGYLAWLADWTYPPNRESFSWFVSEVAPWLSDAALERIRLFGAGDPRFLRAGNSQWGRMQQLVRHAGFVEPLSAVYQEARGVVAPVVRGAGVNNKVLEPLAAGRPVLTTSVGVRGLPSNLVRHVRVAETAQALASELTSLLATPASLDGVEAARAAVRSLTWQAAAATIEKALFAAISCTNRATRNRTF